MTTISIIANGPSAKHHALAVDAADTVIAVNGAIEFVSQPDYWFTLDISTRENLLRMHRPRDGVQYVVATQPYTALPTHVKRYRRIEANNTGLRYGERRKHVKGLAENHNEIHTGNSAYGALGLAYHLLRGCKCGKILLCGVDATQDQRFTGGMSGELSHLPLLFDSAKPQLYAAGIEVYTFSDHGKLDFKTWHEFSSSDQAQTQQTK